MTPYQDDTFLARWLAGQLAKKELDAFKQSEDFRNLTSVLQGVDRLRPPGFDQEELLTKIKAPLMKPEGQTAPLRSPVSVRWWAAAAVLLVGVLAVWWWGNQSSVPNVKYLASSVTEQLTESFPDGTVISLQPGTSVTTRIGKDLNTREAQLNGEAFFDVNQSGSFLVRTDLGDVEVLGTEFSVFARDSLLKVTCYEGSVQVWPAKSNRVLRIPAGQSVRITGSRSQSLSHDQRSPGWLGGISTYQEATMAEVFGDVERQFGIRILYPDSLQQEILHTSFPHSSLKITLRQVLEPSGLSWNVLDDTLIQVIPMP